MISSLTPSQSAWIDFVACKRNFPWNILTLTLTLIATLTVTLARTQEQVGHIRAPDQ